MTDLTLTVDPGGTTGFAWYFLDGDPTAAQMTPFEFCCWAHDLAEQWGPTMQIICERFTITARTLKVSRAGSYDALEVIGVLRYLSRRYCGRDLELQQPADVMRLFSDDRLRKLGWYRPGQPHANDALRHLGFRLAKENRLVIPSLSTSELA